MGQSLAGRVGMLQLPPLSYEEAIQPEPGLTADEFMFRGGYPHLYDASTPNNIYSTTMACSTIFSGFILRKSC